MPASYQEVKAVVIDIVDFHTHLNIKLEYGRTYKSSTKLADIYISPYILSSMPPRFNGDMMRLLGNAWRNVGPFDLTNKMTIGSLILLACGQTGISLPAGEPT